MDRIEFCRHLRRIQTKAERALWQELRNRKLVNIKFRRQVPIGRFVADFYCAEASLIIEVDGGIHAMQRAYDAYREDVLRAAGFHIIRFENHKVLRSMSAVLQAIIDEVYRLNPHLVPLP
jgi:very-short-patch-repair endonuclease